MAVSFPLTFPMTIGIERMTWVAQSLVSVHQSPFTGAQEVQAHQGNWWEAIVTISTLDSVTESDDWISFLVSLNGREGTFLFGDPVKISPRGTALGTPLVKGASQIGGELITDGWNINQTNTLLAGDYIQLGAASSSRLHMVKQNASSDGSGNITIDIFPSLRESPVDNSVIVINNTKGLFRLSSDSSSWEITSPTLYGVSFAIIEAF